MDTDSAPDDLRIAFGLVVIAYGGALAIVLSDAAGIWSGLHSLATLGLLVLGGPVLLVQAFLLRKKRSVARGYTVVFWSSVAFPLGLAVLGVVMSGAAG